MLKMPFRIWNSRRRILRMSVRTAIVVDDPLSQGGGGGVARVGLDNGQAAWGVHHEARCGSPADDSAVGRGGDGLYPGGRYRLEGNGANHHLTLWKGGLGWDGEKKRKIRISPHRVISKIASLVRIIWHFITLVEYFQLAPHYTKSYKPRELQQYTKTTEIVLREMWHRSDSEWCSETNVTINTYHYIQFTTIMKIMEVINTSHGPRRTMKSCDM